MTQRRVAQLFVVILSCLMFFSCAGWAEDQPKDLGALLKATGLKYSEVEAGESWRIPFDLNNGQTLDVFLAYNNEKKHFALIFATIVDREDNFVFNREVLAEAMRLNNDLPGIKFVLDEKHGDIDCQTEIWMKTVTAESLEMYINLVAAVVDENIAKFNQLAGGEAAGG